MKKNNFILNTGLALFSACILFSGCKKTADEEAIKSIDKNQPPHAITGNSEATIAGTKAKDAVLVSEPSSARVAAATYISFDDRTSCTWTPNICNNTFVTWPGYIQSVGSSKWGYAWMSSGPGTNFLPYTTGSHYHIAGFLYPAIEPNPHATAMFGSDWFAFYMQNGSGRINFNLTQILVQTIPITLWYKTAAGSWMYWANLGPGRWNLPGATNIQEFHIRAASGVSSDHWEIDDLAVQAL